MISRIYLCAESVCCARKGISNSCQKVPVLKLALKNIYFSRGEKDKRDCETCIFILHLHKTFCVMKRRSIVDETIANVKFLLPAGAGAPLPTARQQLIDDVRVASRLQTRLCIR